MSYPVPSVTAAIRDAEGRWLLTLRSSKVWAPHYWCLPGGRLDGGQTWVQALRREVMEEVGLTVREEKLVGLYSNPAFHSINVSGQTFYFVTALFLVTRFDGRVTINDEVDQFGWYLPQALPTPMLPADVIKLKDVCVLSHPVFVR